MKIESARYINPPDKIEYVRYDDLDAESYKAQYKGHLYCITDECNVKIKFTPKTNGHNFFSTWNKEGLKHHPECPYLLEEKDSIERNKIIADIIKVPVDEEQILNSLRNKSRNLKNKEKPDVPDKKLTTKKVIDGENITGEKLVDDGTIKEEVHKKGRISSINAKYISPDFIGHRKLVYGIVKNVYYQNDYNYAYLNLINEKHSTSIYLPPAFYEDITLTTKQTYINFINIISSEIRKNPKKQLVIICYGFINNKKEKEGINVHLTNPRYLLINDKTYYDIVLDGTIPFPDDYNL